MTGYVDSKDKYSIIIPYRDREAHIHTLLPRLCEVFCGKNYEIIVAEQDDTNLFCIANLQNIAYKHSSGDVVILHQVDYYPTDDVTYEVGDKPTLPARVGIFLSEDMKELRDVGDIPAGYRNWGNEIDPNFYGGVVAMRRNHWEKINGLNPLYRGWGNEDEDLRERFRWNNITPIRNEVGTFYCLYHSDNGNMAALEEEKQLAFMEGRKILQRAWYYKDLGYKNVEADIEKYDCGIENVIWLKITNFKFNL